MMRIQIRENASIRKLLGPKRRLDKEECKAPMEDQHLAIKSMRSNDKWAHLRVTDKVQLFRSISQKAMQLWTNAKKHEARYQEIMTQINLAEKEREQLLRLQRERTKDVQRGAQGSCQQQGDKQGPQKRSPLQPSQKKEQQYMNTQPLETKPSPAATKRRGNICEKVTKQQLEAQPTLPSVHEIVQPERFALRTFITSLLHALKRVHPFNSYQWLMNATFLESFEIEQLFRSCFIQICEQRKVSRWTVTTLLSRFSSNDLNQYKPSQLISIFEQLCFNFKPLGWCQGVKQTTFTCNDCHHSSKMEGECFRILNLQANTNFEDLNEMLKHYFCHSPPQLICFVCGKKGVSEVETKVVVAPRTTLIVSLDIFANNAKQMLCWPRLFDDGRTNAITLKDAHFRLVSVICHVGDDTESSHFICYSLHEKMRKCVEVYNGFISHDLAIKNMSLHPLETPYILFYEKILTSLPTMLCQPAKTSEMNGKAQGSKAKRAVAAQFLEHTDDDTAANPSIGQSQTEQKVTHSKEPGSKVKQVVAAQAGSANCKFLKYTDDDTANPTIGQSQAKQKADSSNEPGVQPSCNAGTNVDFSNSSTNESSSTSPTMMSCLETPKQDKPKSGNTLKQAVAALAGSANGKNLKYTDAASAANPFVGQSQAKQQADSSKEPGNKANQAVAAQAGSANCNFHNHTYDDTVTNPHNGESRAKHKATYSKEPGKPVCIEYNRQKVKCSGVQPSHNAGTNVDFSHSSSNESSSTSPPMMSCLETQKQDQPKSGNSVASSTHRRSRRLKTKNAKRFFWDKMQAQSASQEGRTMNSSPAPNRYTVDKEQDNEEFFAPGAFYGKAKVPKKRDPEQALRLKQVMRKKREAMKEKKRREKMGVTKTHQSPIIHKRHRKLKKEQEIESCNQQQPHAKRQITSLQMSQQGSCPTAIQKRRTLNDLY